MPLVHRWQGWPKKDLKVLNSVGVFLEVYCEKQ